MFVEDPVTLCCLLLNNPTPFRIIGNRRTTIADLQEAIQEK